MSPLVELGVTEEERETIIAPLLDVFSQSDFEAVSQAEGLEVGIQYAVGMNAVDALGFQSQDDWLIEIIRHAYSKLSSEGQARIADAGL